MTVCSFCSTDSPGEPRPTKKSLEDGEVCEQCGDTWITERVRLKHE